MDGEESFRLACFFGVFLAVALGERFAPRRPLQADKRQRWLTNLSLVAISTLAARLLPVLPVGMAVLAQERGLGLLQLAPLPLWLRFAVSLVALDLAIYLQHRIFHAWPLFWRLHRLHHTDLDIDVTTGNRFHPLEIALSLLLKTGIVALLGAPPLAVIAFEALLNATAQFNHGNLRLPLALDRWLRLVLVTPDMHRVHHSVIPRETDSNFGFNIPLWDRLFGTYRAQPEAGHLGMTIGLKRYRDPAQLTLGKLLLLPFGR